MSAESEIRLYEDHIKLKIASSALADALVAACHSAGIVGDFIPEPPSEAVTERRWATKARAALRLSRG